MPKARDPKGGDARVVWSSDDGERRPAGAGGGRGSGGRTPAGGRMPEGTGAAERGRVKVRRETAGRRGKAVTTVSGLPLDDAELRAMAGRLKKRCGVGGSAKAGVIELQGDHRTVVVEELRAAGYEPVLAGG